MVKEPQYKIVTMPREFIGADAYIPDSSPKPRTQRVPGMGPTKAPPSNSGSAAQAAPRKGLPAVVWFIIGIVITAALAASAFVLYQNYVSQPAAAPTNQNQSQENQNQKPNQNTINQNQNINANENENANQNENENENENANDNENMNENENTNEAGEEESETAIPEQLSLDKLSSQDSDSDSLTDVEERLIGSNVFSRDTDQDGYLDNNELVNLYNPTALTPAALADTEQFKTYTNSVYKYSLLLPSQWTVQSLDDNQNEIMIVTETDEFITVSVQNNPKEYSLEKWFSDQSPETPVDDARIIETTKDQITLRSPDRFTAYFAKGSAVYMIHYNIRLSEKANYPGVFEMMFNSFDMTNALEAMLEEGAEPVDTVSTQNSNLNMNENANSNQNENVNESSDSNNINNNQNSNAAEENSNSNEE